MGLELHHATCFVDRERSGPIEVMRQRWDPAMAKTIAAHVTLVYPWEARDPRLIASWVRGCADRREPFHLRTTGVEIDGGWCGYAVEDVDGGYAALRAGMDAPEFTPGQVPPHITIVHPRTSARAADAHERLRRTRLELEFVVSEVAITAWDGEVWSTVDVIPLKGRG